MFLTITGPVDVNGNKREMGIWIDETTHKVLNGENTVRVTPEEFRRLAVVWDFPLNDEDESIVNPCGNG